MNVVNTYGWPISDIKYRIVRKIFHKWLKVIPDIRPYRFEQFSNPTDDNINVIPTIAPNWDHTPRTGKKGIVLLVLPLLRFRVAFTK